MASRASAEPRAVYGLRVASDIPFPELPPADGPADVWIRRGALPPELDAPTWRLPLVDARIGCYLMKLTHLAGTRVLIRDGREIIVDQAADAEDDAVRTLVLSAALAAVLHQRQIYPYHASAIETPQGAVLFAGASGAGKTSLTHAFVQRGYRLLSDDLCPLEFTPAGLQVRPGPPRVKLWGDVLAADPAGYRRIRGDQDKYLVPLAAARHCAQPLPVCALYVLASGPVAVPTLSSIGGLQRLQALIEHQYGADYLPMASVHGPQFMWQLTAALGGLPMRSVQRPPAPPGPRAARRSYSPAIGAEIAALADLLERDFQSLPLPLPQEAPRLP